MASLKLNRFTQINDHENLGSLNSNIDAGRPEKLVIYFVCYSRGKEIQTIPHPKNVLKARTKKRFLNGLSLIHIVSL